MSRCEPCLQVLSCSTVIIWNSCVDFENWPLPRSCKPHAFMFLTSWENGIPLNKLFTKGERLFSPPIGKHVPKRAESHRCAINTFRKLACNFSTFFAVSGKEHSHKIEYRI